jgi:hypothetical protein
MRAASNGSGGRLCRPASRISANQGVHSHTSVSRITENVVQRCVSQEMGAIPRPSRAAFMTPN